MDSKVGYQSAAILRQQMPWTRIPDIGRIVKTKLCDKEAILSYFRKVCGNNVRA